MIVICDSREKSPLNFSFYPDIEVKVDGLKTGDYSIEGYTESITIERKRSTGELAINLGSKWKQFSDEMLRMCVFPHKVILCEFSEHLLDKFPEESGIPPKHWSKLRMSPNFLKKRLYSIQEVYDIDLIFSPSKEAAEEYAANFLKKAYESLKGN